MKRFSSYLTGLSPWVFAVAFIGFCTRFRTFGKAGAAPDLNYFLLCGIAIGIYSVIMILHFSGVYISGFEHKNPEKNTILNCFDFSVFMIVLLLLLNRVQEISGLSSAIVMSMVSMGISILSLIAEKSVRTDDEISGGTLGGKLMLAGVFAILCGFSALIFNVAFKGVEKVSDVLAEGLKFTGGVMLRVLKFLGTVAGKIIEWIISLLPEEEAVTIIPDQAPSIDVSEMPQVYKDIVVPVWVYYAVGGLIIAAVIMFIVRNIRFGGKVAVVKKKKRVKLKKAGKKSSGVGLIKELRFRIAYIKNRRTAAGMLIYCEKHAPKGHARLKGESGESFLRRLSSEPEILKLADMVEKQFYSTLPVVLTKEDCRSIIKAWNTSLDQ